MGRKSGVPMSLVSDLAEKIIRDQARKLATDQAQKAYAAKCAKDLHLFEGDVNRVLAWIVDKLV